MRLESERIEGKRSLVSGGGSGGGSDGGWGLVGLVLRVVGLIWVKMNALSAACVWQTAGADQLSLPGFGTSNYGLGIHTHTYSFPRPPAV